MSVHFGTMLSVHFGTMQNRVEYSYNLHIGLVSQTGLRFLFIFLLY